MEIKYILQPMLAVILLTFAMTVWMFFTRIPAMKRLRIHPQKAQDTSKLKGLLPESVTRVSNNYNHLFEQPVVFYALCLAIAVLNMADSYYVGIAWAYAAVRITHSLVQATIDKVMVRFMLFIVSWLLLAGMMLRLSWQLFS